MRIYDIIEKKRFGKRLSDDEIKAFVEGYVRGEIPDHQAAALLMAICINGMDDGETLALTLAMRDSGDTADMSRFGALSADKHSTGGVGDKTTLIVAPIAACIGLKFAKMSGRGLGHTGGTVDKLESIKGFRTTMETCDFINQADEIGVAVVGQSGNFAPADKKIYALRDVTATVQSVPLIASSIMSKKLAAGAKSIVLDVKYGSGAFMKTEKDARELAEKMVAIGRSAGRNMRALITCMDAPLGRFVGNAAEVVEASRVLAGKGDAPDLVTVCLSLSAALASAALGISEEEGMRRAKECLENGKALEKFREWIARQGGDASLVDDEKRLFSPKYSLSVKAPRGGYVAGVDTKAIGVAALALGAGRTKKDEAIDTQAGIVIKKKPGETVEANDVIAELYSSDKEKLPEAEKIFSAAYTYSEEKPEEKPLISGKVN